MSVRLLLVLVLVLALAGCTTSPPSDRIAPQARDDPTGATTDLTSAPAPRAGPSSTETLTKVPVSYSGKTVSGICAITPAYGACQWAAGVEAVHTIQAPGRAIAFVGTLTYTSNGPLGTFVAYLCGKTGKEYACTGNVRGASPMKLEWDVSGMPNATEFVLGTYDTVDGPGGPASAAAYLGTEFKVDGQLTVAKSS